MQSDPSNAGDGEKSFRNPQSRSPAGRLHANRQAAHLSSITDQSDEDPAHRSLNRDNKHTRSSRKIKPMYPIPNNHGGKNILKVVQETDNSSAHESNQMPRLAQNGSILMGNQIPAGNNMSPVSNISAPGGQGNAQAQAQQYIQNIQNMQHM